ncbi:MAG: glycerol-3-phosphate 1-O-acyltransferase PlsY [candidate division KSB1 bacterium]|jgi:glycerol-3-phosphate acyltransferase PlsY|nr:glycerol-3-phosphate 1-O-acyltransferase PlsY [candidate division KSB1 bacterium]
MISLIVIILLSYLVGSIPTSIIFSKLFKGIDIRDYGSGNAGGTNAMRVLGWKIGGMVMLIDVLKGVVATLFISSIRIDPLTMNPEIVKIIAGHGAIFGHIWTVFAGFRGGKGVGTGAGMVLALYPTALLICLAIFIIVLLAFRMVSLASMSAAVSMPIVIYVLRTFFDYHASDLLYYFSILIAFLIIFTHRSNIKRILNGNENKISLKKNEP